MNQAYQSPVNIAAESGAMSCGFAGNSEDVGVGTEVSLSSSCAEALADFALGSDKLLRHQYSGLCVGLNPAAPSTIPSPPPPANGAAVESAGIGAGSTSVPLLLSAHLTKHWHIVLCTACAFVPHTDSLKRLDLWLPSLLVCVCPYKETQTEDCQ